METLHLRERILKPYAEPMTVADLKEGIRYDPSNEDERAVFYAQEEKHLNQIFQYESALRTP